MSAIARDVRTGGARRAPRVLSNVAAFDTDGGSLVRNRALWSARPGAGPLRRGLGLVGDALRSYRYDAIFCDGAPAVVLGLCLLLRLLPGNRCQLIFGDPNLFVPTTRREKVRARWKRWLLRRVDLFVLLHHDDRGYRRIYGIDRARVAHVPFKVNGLDLIRQLEPTEGDYLFSGGVTRRDWETLAAAVRDLPIPVIVSIPDDDTLARSGQGTRLPAPGLFGPNVRVVRHDADPLSWLRLAAGARFVVFPIERRTINPAGVSTYLCAMALRKCVIVSKGPCTTGLLDAAAGVVVPPGDPAALRAAILRVHDDPELRRRVAEAGYEHARRAGDSPRYHRDLIACIVARVAAERKMSVKTA